MTRRKAQGAEPRRLGLAALVGTLIIVLSAAFAFGRGAVLDGGPEIQAAFASGNQLKKGSAVRRAGTDIGKVTGVRASDDGRAIVTMRLDDDAPPVRADSRLAIRARLAFEGNFYVDVVGGSADAPVLRRGETIPLTQTTVPVQLDQVLSTLDASVRTSARRVLGSLSEGLGPDPDGGASGATALRRTVRKLRRAAGPAGRVADAMRGRADGDLGRSLRATAELLGDLSRDDRALAGIVREYSRVVDALGSQDDALRAGLDAGARTLRTAPASLRRIDAMLPELTRLAGNLTPALERLPTTLVPVDRAFREVELMARDRELPAAVRELAPLVRDLPTFAGQLGFVLPYVGPIGRCLSEHVVSALEQRVPDGRFTVDQPAWLELLHAAASLTGGSPAFDGNGATFRAGLGIGTSVMHGALPGIGQVVSSFDHELEGVRPVWLGYDVKPAKRPDSVCEDQPRVKLESRNGRPFGGHMELRERTGPLPTARTREGRAARADLLAPLRDQLDRLLRPAAGKDAR
ncbi:MAG: MlaD family protein [Solirubrobacteraceae bacterium]|nr:MlaD family protein [Solirubrobacteraceae bacterium]